MITSTKLHFENSHEALLHLNREYQRILFIRNNIITLNDNKEICNEGDVVKRATYSNRIGRFPFFLRENHGAAPSALDTIVIHNDIIQLVDTIFQSKEVETSSTTKNQDDNNDVVYPILLDAYISSTNNSNENCTNVYEKYCLVAAPRRRNDDQYDAVVVNVMLSKEYYTSVEIYDLNSYNNHEEKKVAEQTVVLQIIYQKSTVKHLDIGKSAYIRYLERCRDWISTLMNPMQRSALGFPHVSHKIWKDCDALQQMYWRYPDIHIKDYNSTAFKVNKFYNNSEDCVGVGVGVGAMNRQCLKPPDGVTSNDPRSNLHDKARFVYPEPTLKSGNQIILTKTQIDQFLNEGYLLVKGIWDNTLLQSALKDVKTIWPETFKPQNYQTNNQSSHYFPFDHASLNKITLHPNLLRIVSQLMDVPIHRIRITQSACFAKRGPVAQPKKKKRKRSSTSNCYFEDGNQPIHQDFGNNTLLTPCNSYFRRTITNNTKLYDNKPEELQAMLYYNDFEEVGGGTSFVPGLFHTGANPFHLGWLPHDMTSEDEKDPRPSLYSAERIAAYSFGSILFYTLGTWHRGTSVYPGCLRRVQHLCFCRDDVAHWVGSSEVFGQPTTNSLLKVSSSNNITYQSNINVQDLNPEQRSVLGFPYIDSKYWNKQTIEDTCLRYESKLDLTSYGNNEIISKDNK